MDIISSHGSGVLGEYPVYGKRTLFGEECIVWIPCGWETYINGGECIVWIPGVWETYINGEECI